MVNGSQPMFSIMVKGSQPMSLFKTQNVCNLHCGWDYKGKLVHRSVPGDWAWVFARAIISRPTAAENIHYWPALYHINQTPAWKPKLKGGENFSLLRDAIYDLFENFSFTSHNSSWINIEATFHNYCSKNLVGPSKPYFEPWTTFAMAALIKISLISIFQTLQGSKTVMVSQFWTWQESC